MTTIIWAFLRWMKARSLRVVKGSSTINQMALLDSWHFSLEYSEFLKCSALHTIPFETNKLICCSPWQFEIYSKAWLKLVKPADSPAPNQPNMERSQQRANINDMIQDSSTISKITWLVVREDLQVLNSPFVSFNKNLFHFIDSEQKINLQTCTSN